MPGQEHLAARARVAESVMPDGPEFARPPAAPIATSSGPDAGTGPPPSRSLASRTNRPAVAALIATLAALAFALARWQTWAQRQHQPVHPGRPAFRHASSAAAWHAGGTDLRLRRAVLLPAGAQSAQLPPDRVRHHHGPALPVHADRLSGADLAGLARPALPGPHHAGRRQHRRRRRPGLPGRPVRRRRRAARAGRAAAARILRPHHQPVPGHRRAARRRLPAGRAARGPGPATRPGRRAPRLRRADQGNGHGRRGRHRHHAGRRHPARPGARPGRRRSGLGGAGRRLRGLAGRGEGRDRKRSAARRRRPERGRALRRPARGAERTTSPTSIRIRSTSTTCGSSSWPSSPSS